MINICFPSNNWIDIFKKINKLLAITHIRESQVFSYGEKHKFTTKSGDLHSLPILMFQTTLIKELN